MTTPLPFLEEQLAVRADMVSRLEGMKKHLESPGSSGSFGVGRNYEDVTEQAVAELERQIAEVDERIRNIRDGNA